MSTEATQHVLTATLRANPRYELAAFDRLSPSEQALLGPLTADADFHGVLRPREPGTLSFKGVSHDTARLLQSLERPGPIPPFVVDPSRHSERSREAPRVPADGGQMRNRDRPDRVASPSIGMTAIPRSARNDTDTARGIARLILDGVLEIEHEARFIGGPAAMVALRIGPRPIAQPTAMTRLSEAALRYAQSLPVDDSLALSARMYFYNRTPVSPTCRRRYSDPATIAATLGLDALERDEVTGPSWSRDGRPGAEQEGWFQWRRHAHGEVRRSRGRATFKLYVSARHESLRDVVPIALGAFRRSHAFAYKIGSTEQQLCRPDKLVAYFETRPGLDEVASELARALRGARAHGVPFTAALTDDGLLSWGVDPPSVPQVMWRERESWRLWVTNRLAIALVAARRAGPIGVEPWEFAVSRLELDGVDTRSWTPDASFWNDTDSCHPERSDGSNRTSSSLEAATGSAYTGSE